MHTKQFDFQISKLTEAIKNELPGQFAHSKMAPAHRDKLIREGKGPEFARKSAVLILLFPDEKGNMNTVFIKRMEYDGVHSGQIAFPGGKYEDSDADLISTALREAEEEVGIHTNEVTILGRLSDLFVPPSNFIISPIIGMIREKPEFHPDKNEVAEVFTVPLAHFFEPSNFGDIEIQLRNNQAISVPGYFYKDHLIWGATAMILSEFLSVLES